MAYVPLLQVMSANLGLVNLASNGYYGSNIDSSLSLTPTTTPTAQSWWDSTIKNGQNLVSLAVGETYRITFRSGHWIECIRTSTSRYEYKSDLVSTTFAQATGVPYLYFGIYVDTVNELAVVSVYNYSVSSGRAYAGLAPWTTINKSTLYNAIISSVIPVDPNTHGGLSAKEGGDGSFDDTSDVIDIPSLPGISVSDSGFVTIYNPTGSEMLDIANALISPNIFQALAQNFVKLSDVVIGLSIFPFTIPDGGQREVKINVLGVQLSTGVMCTKAARQFVDIDCGSIQIEEYWGNCLDYSPYTKISIYLPYCGYQELNTDEVMNGNLGVKYRVDLVSGACMAYVTVNGTVLYQFSGECSTQIPISSVDYSQFVSAFIGLGGTAHNASVSNGVASAAAEEAMGTENEGNALREQQITRTYNNARIIDSAVGAICSMKPRFMHAGALSASIGFLGVQKPFLIIERARQSLPDGYAGYHGYPSNITAKLGDLFGYTEVDSIHLNIPNATVNEIIECENLLKGGVVL